MQTYSHSQNGTLTNDAILTITNNNIKIIGDVKYDIKTYQLTNQSTAVIYVATLNIQIDNNAITDWLKLNENEQINFINKYKSIQQAIIDNNKQAEFLKREYINANGNKQRALIQTQFNDVDNNFLEILKVKEDNISYYQQAIAENDKRIEEIRQRAQLATTDAERAAIQSEFEQTDIEFFIIQKIKKGKILAYQGDYFAAINEYNEAIRLSSNYANAYNNCGDSYCHIGDYKQAIANYTKAIELNQDYVNAYSDRGIAYSEVGNYTAAIADCTKAIQLNPNYANVYYNRGLCYQKMGDKAKAEADFAKARALGYNG